jgi:hypothetical protein
MQDMSPKAIIALRWSWMNKPILKNALSFSISGSVAPSIFWAKNSVYLNKRYGASQMLVLVMPHEHHQTLDYVSTSKV